MGGPGHVGVQDGRSRRRLPRDHQPGRSRAGQACGRGAEHSRCEGPGGARRRAAGERAAPRGGRAYEPSAHTMRAPRGAAGRRRGAIGRGDASRVSHFRTEIAEQVDVASRLLERGQDVAATIGDRIRDAAPRGFVIAARGSSDNAALYAKYLFGVRNSALVALAAPSLFTHYARAPKLDGQCVIGVSQSGESPDVIAVIEEARRQGCVTVAITNAGDSKLARAAELVLTLEAGPEVSVPASKTYTASVLAMALISQALDPDPVFEAALQKVPAAIGLALEREAELDVLVQPLMTPRAVVLGRGYNFSTAEEIALKLSE